MRMRNRLALACMTLVAAIGTVRASGGNLSDPGGLAGQLKSPLINEYCDVPTYVVPQLIGQARAIIQHDGTPLILIDAAIATNKPYARFLLAHECCHHTRGHLTRLAQQQKRRQRGASMSFLTTPLSYRNIELDADCCAAAMLAKRDDLASLEAAISTMNAYGVKQTGALHPVGLQRATVIANCGKVR